MLTSERAVEQVRILKPLHETERDRLDIVRQYWKGSQPHPAVIAPGAPARVRAMANSSRVNVCAIVVDSLAQSVFVDGFRAKREADDAEVWKVWQANHMDARQTGIHRAAFAYGAAYAVVLPGSPVPVIRGVSPRSMTALYGEDPDWPMWALERRDGGLWRLYDDDAIYHIGQNAHDDLVFVDSRAHGAPVTPVVRYLDEDDLDLDDEADPAANGRTEAPVAGQVAPLIPVQDQIDLTTFDLQVAQHFGAFRQRWAIGWTAESETELLKASAAELWTFDRNPEGPEGMKLGEFSQTDVKGYIESREASLRHGATLSQTPVHELTGSMVNLSAEALVAAENGRDRKVDERKLLLGESHEQTLWLAGRFANVDVPDDASVVWRDTSARAFSATVDGLGKLAQMLEIPPQELWERIPGATRQDIERWKKAAEDMPPEPPPADTPPPLRVA